MNKELNVQIERYKYTRFWGVWVNEELLAVVCYRKGANAIRSILLNGEFDNYKDKKNSLQKPIPGPEEKHSGSKDVFLKKGVPSIV